jgi:putative ABC transport system permease protein
MAVEIALALVLLIGTVLLIRTFLVLRPASPGFDASDRMVASIALPASHDASTFAHRLLDNVGAAAPAARAAIATDVPLSGLVMVLPVLEVDGEPADPAAGRRNEVEVVASTPGYFAVIGMQMARGRGLAATDAAGSTPVVVVNERAAGRFWPDGDALGRSILIDGGDRPIEFVVVGVSRDTRSSGNHLDGRPTAFVSFWQVPWQRFQLVLHQPAGAAVTGEAVRRIVAAIDAGVPVGSIAMLEEMVAGSVADRRYHMTLMSVFAGLAVILALVGCYGVLSYSVAQRTREIGVRMALGASHGAILRSVMLRGTLLVTLGLIAGTAIALALTRVLASYLFGVPPTDPATFAAAAAGLALVSLAAVWLPARRAATVQPVEALRAD